MAMLPSALSPSRRLSDAFAPNASDNVWLDCLRSLAILLVLLRHGQRMLETGSDITFLETLSLNGWAGVDLFFVLSGYLVTAGLLRKYEDHGAIHARRYATKRIRRIVPAYVFVLTLVVVGYFPFFLVSGENLTARVAYHLVFLQDVLPSDINVVFWSLGVEAKYYAMIPIVVLMVARLGGWKVVLGLGLLVVLLGPALRWMIFSSGDYSDYVMFWSALRSPFYACLEPMALGFLIAVMERRGLLRLCPLPATILFVVSLAGLALYLGSHVFLDHIDLWDATAQPLILALVFSVLVIAALGMRPVQTRFEPLFRYGARVSYSLYLVHFPLIPLSLGLAHAMNWGTPGFWGVYMGLSLLHAVFILAYIEMPAMRPRQASTEALGPQPKTYGV